MNIEPELVKGLSEYAGLEMEQERIDAQAPVLGGIIGMVRNAVNVRFGDIAPVLTFRAEWDEE